MERRNYFEMLGLDFDPPEEKQGVIKQALDDWKKKKENLLAGEANPAQRSAISAELDLYDDIFETLKDSKKRKAEAEELKKKKIEQLKKMIDIMLVGQTGTPEVTNAQIVNVSSKIRLSKDTVKKVYLEKGYSLRPKMSVAKLNDYFLNTVALRQLNDYFVTLRSSFMKDINQQQYYPWVENVVDLYSLACFFSGSSDVESYRKKRTAELCSIMEVGSQKFVTAPNNVLLKALSDLFAFGQSTAFNSEENRKKYDRSLEREKLKGFFALIKGAPDDFKKDRYFAESCIKTIQKSFPDYTLSLALYNQEAGLVQNPYEPVEALIHVTCAVCKAPMEFRTREEAEQGKCTVCGAALYVTCPNPKCHKKVPASADWCSCGFHISEMQFFDEYYNAAQFALKEMDLPEARKQLANAENAYPGHPKLVSLKKQVQDETAKYQKPLDDLQALISAGKFYVAQKMIGVLSASMPQLKMEAQKKVITEKLDEAKRMMPAANLTASARANRCAEILDLVKDYQPAIDMLRGICPNAPINLYGTIGSGEPLTCMLTWSSAGDKGVRYCVVRKRNGIPQSHSDGDVLAADLSSMEYRDKTIQPGISYGYAVFASRGGAYSDPATQVVEKFCELDSRRLRATAEDGVCRFSWVLPTNCIGVRILRRVNALPSADLSGNVTVAVERASANFDDTAVMNNRAYGYRLQCVYPFGNGFRYSEGCTVMLTPEPPPVSVRNVTAKTVGRVVTVHWTAPDATPRSVMIRGMTSVVAGKMVGQVVSASDINSILGNGQIYANTTSLAQQCQFEIPAHTSVAFAVVTVAGSRGIISKVLCVSSVEKCEIDKTKTRIDGDNLKIYLQNIPRNLEKVHYIIAKKVDSNVPWATTDDARRGTLQVITKEDYIKDGMIVMTHLPKENLYLSVIGQYRMSDGSTVYSDVSKLKIGNKPKQKIKYSLSWGGLFSRKPQNCKLYVMTNAPETPMLKLVCRSDGHIPMKFIDPKNIVLHTIPESETGLPDGNYSYRFPDSTWEKLASGTQLKLMMAEEDMAEYEISCTSVESLKVPK